MRNLVLAAGVAAVVALGGVPTAAVLAANGSHSHHATASAGSSARGHGAKNDEGPEKAEKSEKAEKDQGKPGSAEARDNGAMARAHQASMKRFSACVRAAAKTGHGNPTAHCVKPLPPGWLKHPGKHTGDRPGASSGKGD